MAWTYILECADGSFYVGSTTDLDRRVSQHQLGEGSAFTGPVRRRPVRLVWAGDVARVDEAFAFERRVQGWGRAKRIALIEGRWNDPPALARGHCRRPLAPDDEEGGDEKLAEHPSDAATRTGPSPGSPGLDDAR